VTEVQETAHQPASRQDIQRSIEIQDEQERFREEAAKEDGERLKILFRDPNPKISGPVKDALGELMPEITEHMFGIKVTVPELVAMQKTYDEATEQGWHVEDVYEWAALSEEERKTFKELREKAYGEGLLVSKYMEGLKTRSSQLSKENERLSIEVDGLKLKEKSLNDRCSWLNTWLEEDYQRKKKGLEEKYLRDIDGCQGEFLEFKAKMQGRKEELQNDYKAWEAKRDNLIAECGRLEKQAANIVEEAKDSLDKVKGETAEAVKERDMARSELKQLRALVGPRGTVADLAKRNEDLKAQLAERDQQLAEKAMQLAGKWLNQEEALQTFNEESKRFMGEVEDMCRLVSDEVEHRIENAGPALRVLEFLESELPDDKFKELTFAMNLAEVKRESLNPDNPYFAHLSARKKELLGVFPTTEEYQRLHKEKMENLHKRREAQLQKIREAANEIATTETWEKIGERLLTALKPIVEAYFNPKQD
jgi:chromosome segregation ATPase